MKGRLSLEHLTLAQIWALLEEGMLDEKKMQSLEDDPRKGARKLLQKYQREKEKKEEEKRRIHELKKYELQAKKAGFSIIAGVDEAGRGPLAGPVVAAAVILPLDIEIEGINDSKKLSSARRQYLYKKIYENALDISVAMVHVEEIDRMNIHRASLKAMYEAVNKLTIEPVYLLVDGFTIPHIKCEQKAVISGDSLSYSIAAASIVAKVTRDNYMQKLDNDYPQYGFCRHKGYGTEAHIKALRSHGVSPVHRLTFLRGLY